MRETLRDFIIDTLAGHGHACCHSHSPVHSNALVMCINAAAVLCVTVAVVRRCAKVRCIGAASPHRITGRHLASDSKWHPPPRKLLN